MDGELPLVVRRGVTIRQVSLVQWPAYDAAGVTGVHLRTRTGEQRHLESVLAIVEPQRVSAEVSTLLARRRESA